MGIVGTAEMNDWGGTELVGHCCAAIKEGHDLGRAADSIIDFGRRRRVADIGYSSQSKVSQALP